MNQLESHKPKRSSNWDDFIYNYKWTRIYFSNNSFMFE